MKDSDENNNKGFLVALTSIIAVCTIIFLGIIIFFPNKNLASDIASKNIILQEIKDEKVLDKKNDEDTLNITDNSNEIIIDLTKEINKDKSLSSDLNNKTPIRKQESQAIKQSSTNIVTLQKPKTIAKTKKTTKAQNKNSLENKYDPSKEYYIQYASLSDPISADNNIQELMKYKINAKIYSATVNDKDLYRVRSGPYKTISEAKLDLKKISRLSSFKEAYILTINK
ncbi:sporulation protein [Candidatus Borreliella tachyglossi]|uniref:Sporulation protein n=1 Tax=Candidatus Borreliella tachyglossi TaxID=1964448 RepID=A0A2S1LX90_9SPIR|nr:SPOR domain-containing protein [Candidatus Borreliella tachyglossi]AWG42913.1 sporulation protein [Candidatus Borreliella tachyglossi]